MPNPRPHTDPGDYVTIRELDARIDTVMSELRWQRWGLFALLAATVSPKVGGPSLPEIAAFAAQLV